MAKNKVQRKCHVKKGDRVEVINGAYKGVVSDVTRVFPKENKLIVSGVNMVTKHQKPTQANQQGGIIEREAKIDASNVLLYCDKCQHGVRYHKRINEDGTKTRICAKCGNELDQ